MSEWTGLLRARLGRLRLDPAREAEIVEELAQHLDQRYEEHRRTGATDAEARRLAIEELLEPEALAARMRSLRQANVVPPVPPGAPRRRLLGDLAQDLRYAARMVGKHRGFTAAAVLTLALGIGANSAIFALVDATLLRPLPLPNPDRLVAVWERTPASERASVSPLNLVDWRTRTSTLESLAGFVPNVGGMVMAGADGTAETVPRQWVTAGIFDVLGIHAIAGRTFLPSDDEARANVVVLSEGFWRRRFNADPGVVGTHVRLDGDPFQILGVVPDEAQIIGRSDMWAMLSIEGAPPTARTAYMWRTIGRLKAGATVEAARADLEAIASALEREYPETNRGRSITLIPLHDAVVGADLRQTSLLFFGVVGIVLLICCANVANLLLARAASRERELAVRSALGADRRRVIRQLLTESLVLAVTGGALGLAVGAAILRLAPSLAPPELLPSGVEPAFDMRVVAFCFLAALFVGVLFGLAPAWFATGRSAAPAVASGTRTVAGRGGTLRRLLVVAQVATAVTLLFGAGLLLRTLLALENVDRGYRAESVLTLIVDPIGARYPTPEALMQFYASLEREVLAVPGVRDVSWASTLPLGDSYYGAFPFEVVGAPRPDGPRPQADYQIVGPAYFEAIDLPVTAGRAFTVHDDLDSARVCIVNEAFVRRHLQGRSPIGAQVAFRLGAPGAPPVVREVVGVARQVKGRPDETEDLVQAYVPLAQQPVDDIFMVVRPESGDAAALAPAVRAAIGRVDTEQLVSIRGVKTLDDIAREATAWHRFRAVLVLAFAGLTLLLAMVGLFGILAYSVQQRIRDFGLRRALGATTGDVLRLVVGSAARVTAAGVIIGLGLSMLSGRLLEAMLFSVEPFDMPTFAIAIAVVTLTAAVSTAAPAWRAVGVDPAVALRIE